VKITEAQVRILLSDGVPRKFTQLGFSLLITRLKGLYKADPSPDALERCTQEINAFLQKFEVIMQQDITILAKL